MKKHFLNIIFIIVYVHFTFSQITLVQNVADLVVANPSNLVVNGNVFQEQNRLIQNNGVIALTGDWKNNSSNIGLDTLNNNGDVIFSGVHQKIYGNSSTYFFNLVFENSAIKSSETNFFIRNNFYLNDAVLELNSSQVHLTNPAVNSLVWNNGFISSNNLEGYFLRSTNSTGNYAFPLGNELLANDYRAVELTPKTNDLTVFGAKLSAVNASLESGVSAAGSVAPFDLESKVASLSDLHDGYYWAVNRFSGNADANISFYTFNSDANNMFTSLAKWNSLNETWENTDFSLLPPSSIIPEFNSPDLSIRSNLPLTYEDDIYVLSDVDLKFPQVFTPNGDGVNDFLIIEGLDLYPNNSIEIFNRWGEQVFQSSPYNNNWNGRNNSKAIKIQGDQLQDDTYFYVLKLGENEPVISKYIELVN